MSEYNLKSPESPKTSIVDFKKQQRKQQLEEIYKRRAIVAKRIEEQKEKYSE